MQRGASVSAACLAILAIATSALAQDLPEDFLITLERTWLHCGGECPAYTVSIDAQGSVTYDGKMYVRVVGPATDLRRLGNRQIRRAADEHDPRDRTRFGSRHGPYVTPPTLRRFRPGTGPSTSDARRG